MVLFMNINSLLSKLILFIRRDRTVEDYEKITQIYNSCEKSYLRRIDLVETKNKEK